MIGYGGSDAMQGSGQGYKKTHSFLLGLLAHSLLIPEPLCKKYKYPETSGLYKGLSSSWSGHVDTEEASQPTATQVIPGNVPDRMWWP